ncbi:LD-carboxypeptidase [Niastella yeongjuensis]|uniref:LD-carboxypeptidase n=1 Tax=Niastella yeongjuensis TaxID=354355 RepID=A0A1V9ENT7_9BACT|nr:LD-carboxypeptidase [Niastella yeongjuensis]OQP47786.1 LD-carboxypeptidase [Niastella yeongjuensis]SEP45240.1 muramoyltetrapeptide carboxypeptidase [Niastella yeongjuensis]
MNRKYFLSSFLVAGLPLPGWSAWCSDGDSDAPAPVLPRYLKPGDTIGITCPAGFITLPEIQPAMLQMIEWGFNIKVGDTVGKKDFTFGGTDEERAHDFQQMIDDPKVKAIMCARGGYGFVRIIDKLDFTKLVAHPKWIIGFSDITVLHCHLNRNYGIASIHSKMCNSFPDDWNKAEPIQIETILSIKQALTGQKMKYTVPVNPLNKPGRAEGTLIGGNLKLIETLAGTKSDLRTTNKILFVEDTGEYLYSIDRMFWNLKRTGKLEKLAGLIVGGFKIKPDDPGEEFGRTIQDIVLEKVKDYHYPVCFDFPVGHQRNNYALKCGVKHQLTVSNEDVILREI